MARRPARERPAARSTRRAAKAACSGSAPTSGYTFPAWQFGRDGNVLPALPRVISAARSVGISDERLGSLLQARSGLGSGRVLADALRDGNVDHVLSVVYAAA